MTLVLIFGVACSSEVSEGRGTLPTGMQDDLVPDVEYDLYLYFNPDAAVDVDYQRFLGADQEEVLVLGGDDGVALTSVSIVATSLEQFGGYLGFATSSDAALVGSLLERDPVEDQATSSTVQSTPEDPLQTEDPPIAGPVVLSTVQTVPADPPKTDQLKAGHVKGPPTDGHAASSTVQTVPGDSPQAEGPTTIVRVASTTVQIIRGDSEWIEGVSKELESVELAPLKEGSSQAWNMLTNLPVSEDEPPVAAGFISTDGDLIQEIADSAGIQVPGLDTAFGMVRVDNVAFGIYSKLPESIPEEIDVDLLDSLDTGVVLVGGAGYAGVAVAFLVRSIAGKIGMDTIALANTNARHLELEDGHFIIKNKGSLIYATVAGSRARAEELILRALAE